MAGKHTPGPWKLYGSSIMVSGGTDTYSGSVLGSIAFIYDTEQQDGDGRSWSTSGSMDANAHLIAASPDLLEALRSVDEMFSSPGSINKQTIMKEVRAAIAKAEGRE